MALQVGVVLSGCGVFDGSEIHEAVSILIALDRHGAQITCMAPNIPQAGVTNHLTKRPEANGRRVLEESARIARGNIRDIATLKAADLDALIFPGGFGAAKNLCTFATDGPNCKVNDQVERLMLEMHAAGKPIGLACIAPVLAARVFGARQLRPVVTIGNDLATAGAIVAMKAQHRDTATTDVCVDEANRLVTTPCYMTAAGPWQVYQGAEKMVDEVLRLAKAK
ncbi:MAG TPA: isoprenoid biosynthesis glyoxalase ElbB [Tepidisphaeraceae bacterium]|nr:isoprenoid biosynthesis glyoxalase ElbB [Tepidisphaeraceae bacterium]